MTKAAGQYVREQTIVGGVVNLLLNAGLAWLLYRHVAVVPLAGEQSVTSDLMATAFLVPLLVTVIVKPLVRRDVARGRLDRDSLSGLKPRSPHWLPANAVVEGVLLGLIGLVLVGAPTVWLLRLLRLDGLTVGTFAAVKAGMAGLVALCVTRWVVGRTLAERHPVPSQHG